MDKFLRIKLSKTATKRSHGNETLRYSFLKS